MKKDKNSRTLKAGTVIKLGETPITLTEDTEIAFDGAANEENFVGILVNSKNLDVNRETLGGSYNAFGRAVKSSEAQAEAKIADAPKDSKEFKEAQKMNEERAGFLPVEPQDPDNVPQHQRAPELGSPDLADTEKMNNMENIPSQIGFNPLASKPDGEAGSSGKPATENATAGEINSGVDPNAGTHDDGRIGHNNPVNTAQAAAKGQVGIDAQPSDGGMPVSDGGMTPAESKAAAEHRGEQSEKSANGEPVVDSDDAKSAATKEVAKGEGTAAQKTAATSKTPAKTASRKKDK